MGLAAQAGLPTLPTGVNVLYWTMNLRAKRRCPEAVPARNHKPAAGGHITITAREYALLYDVYLSAEHLSQCRYIGADSNHAERELNQALCKYESWSEDEPVELRNSRTQRALRTPRRKLMSN